MTEPTKFTREQVANHNDKSKAVFIIDNVVYNVTQFLDEHPGGHEVLINEIGKDTTEMFDDIGHSIDAKALMKDFIVGELVEEDRIEKKKRELPFSFEDVAPVANDDGFMSSWKFPVLLGVMVTVLYSYLFG